METEPLTHVIRPTLPWRDPSMAMTECGLQADSYPSVSRDEASARWRKLGAQRASLWFCMTCVQTAERWPSWDQDPVGCIGRYTERARYRRGDTEGDEFRRELIAIAQLIELHRDDFDGIVAGLGETVSLRDRRDARRNRGRR